jgi:hypothetical protein
MEKTMSVIMARYLFILINEYDNDQNDNNEERKGRMLIANDEVVYNNFHFILFPFKKQNSEKRMINAWLAKLVSWAMYVYVQAARWWRWGIKSFPDQDGG